MTATDDLLARCDAALSLEAAPIAESYLDQTARLGEAARTLLPELRDEVRRLSETDWVKTAFGLRSDVEGLTAERDRLRDEVRRLSERYAGWVDQEHVMSARLVESEADRDRLREQVEIAREALEWYAKCRACDGSGRAKVNGKDNGACYLCTTAREARARLADGPTPTAEAPAREPNEGERSR